MGLANTITMPTGYLTLYGLMNALYNSAQNLITAAQYLDITGVQYTGSTAPTVATASMTFILPMERLHSCAEFTASHQQFFELCVFDTSQSWTRLNPGQQRHWAATACEQAMVQKYGRCERGL